MRTASLVAFISLFATTVPAIAQGGKTHHVIFVVNSDNHDAWSEATMLADHYVNGVKPDAADVEVLAYGPAVEMLKKGSPDTEDVANDEKLGIHFAACRFAMKHRNLTDADLLPGVVSVPFAVLELVAKQEAGYAYVQVTH